MYYRTLEERDYFASHILFLQRILDGEEPISRWYHLDPTELMGRLTRIDAFRKAHCWGLDYDYGVRRRNRDDRDTDAQGNPDPSHFVGWHNIELFGVVGANGRFFSVNITRVG